MWQVMLLGVATFAISLWALIESVRSIHGAASHFWTVVAQAQNQVRAPPCICLDSPGEAPSGWRHHGRPRMSCPAELLEQPAAFRLCDWRGRAWTRLASGPVNTGSLSTWWCLEGPPGRTGRRRIGRLPDMQDIEWRPGLYVPQVEGIQQTLDSVLTDLIDVYDAFMILWWRVISSACARLLAPSVTNAAGCCCHRP